MYQEFDLSEVEYYVVWKFGKFRFGYYEVRFFTTTQRRSPMLWRVRNV